MAYYSRDDMINSAVRYFADKGDFKPTTTDIRVVTNDIGDSYIRDGLMSEAQWNRISQDRTIKSVRAGLKKAR